MAKYTAKITFSLEADSKDEANNLAEHIAWHAQKTLRDQEGASVTEATVDFVWDDD